MSAFAASTMCVFVFYTLVLWVPLLCLSYYQAVVRYLYGRHYRIFLCASCAIFVLLNSMPFWMLLETIAEHGRDYIPILALHSFGFMLCLFAIALFWLWPCLLLWRIIKAVEALAKGRKRERPDYVLLISLGMLCLTQLSVHFIPLFPAM